MTGKIVSIAGGLPNSVPKVSQAVIEDLEEYLEMAKAGEIVAFVGAVQHCDGLGSYRIAGHLGGYSVVGALKRAEHHLQTFMDEDE